MVAVAKVAHGWLLLQRGDFLEAGQAWDDAYDALEHTEDCTNLGNIWFFRARRLCRAGLNDEGRSAYQRSVTFYSVSESPHRNLRRCLIRLADLEYRMAMNEGAAKNIARAAELLEADGRDVRNRGRLLLVQAKLALCGPKVSLAKARQLAKKAYELARDAGDEVIMPRGRYMQAVVELREAERGWDEDPGATLCRARQYANGAVELAKEIRADRLRARCHTLLGNLYLEPPFPDTVAATRQWEAAVENMSQHQDMDYLVEEIQALEERLGSTTRRSEDNVIFSVTAGNALDKPLEGTVRAVERAVVLAALKRFGEDDSTICKVLQTGRNRIEKCLSQPMAHGSERPMFRHDPDGPVIFRVTAALAFGQPLQDTIREVERAIIRASCIQYHCNQHEVRKSLSVGHERFRRHFSDLEPELRPTECPEKP